MEQKQKILTVSIAAYNVEPYLRKTLDSCCIPSIMDGIEVLIVNDGSKDGTSAIGHEYEAKWPGTFRVIDKENGGYGSTVNTAMAQAKGKYFRLLDGDDWFDQEGLEKLVTFLAECEADCVLSGRLEVDAEGQTKHTDNEWFRMYAEKLNGQSRSPGELTPFIYGMWEVAYRTEMLRAHPFTLPEHMLYTDRLYVVYPIPWIRRYAFVNYDVYCYRVGHEGQSVSVENRIRHLPEIIGGFDDLVKYYGETAERAPEANREFMKARISQYYNNVIRSLFLLPASKKAQGQIREIEARMKEISLELYTYCGENNRFIGYCRKYGYAVYWLRKTRKAENWK